ncbi:MAG TPA: polyprenyl synthetase family protein [Saprospiraceae bacterium]|nr:polyprenyl synthetase family protein [Saprospiraceae bacterium]
MEFIEVYHSAYLQFAESQLKDKTPLNLYEPLRYITEAAGKRIRPVLTLMACEAFSNEFNHALPFSYAVEIFHNFTLIHDDIMDHAEKRRGLPSAHIKYGLPQAILSGDVMMIYAFTYLLNKEYRDVGYKAARFFSDIAIGVCEGQQLDMDFENQVQVSINDYIQMITLKTSILLGAALQLGAMAGGAGQEDQRHLFEFGKNIGIAFQIHDDILDVFGEVNKTGKIHAGDIINSKKTYLYLKSLELCTPVQREKLISYYTGESVNIREKIEFVTGVFKELAVLEYANLLKEAYLQLGKSHLQSLSVENQVISNLERLADYLIERDY